MFIKVGITLLSLTLLMNMVFVLPVKAADEAKLNIPKISILPDSPLYIFKQIGERIGDFFTIGKGRQAIRDLNIAQKRLWESQALIDKGDTEQIKTTFNKYLSRLENSKDEISKLKSNEAVEKYLPQIKAKLENHKVSLDDILQTGPETITDLWQQATSQLEKYRGVLDILQSDLINRLGDVAKNIRQQEQIQQDIEADLQKKLNQ